MLHYCECSSATTAESCRMQKVVGLIRGRCWTDLYSGSDAQGGTAKAFYSSRPGYAWDFTHVRLIFMNDSFIKCVSSILKYWRNILITEENELINQPHSVIFMNNSFIKCVSSILKYWRNNLISEENELINQPHNVVHPRLYCRWP